MRRNTSSKLHSTNVGSYSLLESLTKGNIYDVGAIVDLDSIIYKAFRNHHVGTLVLLKKTIIDM